MGVCIIYIQRDVVCAARTAHKPVKGLQYRSWRAVVEEQQPTASLSLFARGRLRGYPCTGCLIVLSYVYAAYVRRAYDQLKEVRQLEYELDFAQNRAARDKAALKERLAAALAASQKLQVREVSCRCSCGPTCALCLHARGNTPPWLDQAAIRTASKRRTCRRRCKRTRVSVLV